MLLAVAGVLALLWLGGFLLNIVGSVVHGLLVLAVVVAIAHFVMGQRRRVA